MLPRPTFHFFTSLGLCWQTFLLYQPISLCYSSGFLDPITTSLLLITTWVYWLLGQPIKFTNSFPRLLRPIYSLSTSYYSHGLTTSFIGLPRPTYFLFTSFYSCGACQLSILPFRPARHALLVSLLIFFILLSFFYC